MMEINPHYSEDMLEDGKKITNRWDLYFYNIAREVAKQSRCLSRQIGCIIVKDKSIITTGYNGPPRGIPDCSTRSRKEGVCPRQAKGFVSGEGLHLCPAAHAEANAIVNVARLGGTSTVGTSMYLNCGVPCKNCLGLIINAGIKELVVTNIGQYDFLSGWMLKNGEHEIIVRTYA